MSGPQSAPGERKLGNVDDITQEERHLVAFLHAELGNGLHEFLDCGLQFAPCEVLAQAAMNAVAQRDVRGLTVQPHFLRIVRSEEHTYELQSLIGHSYAVFCLKIKKHKK